MNVKCYLYHFRVITFEKPTFLSRDDFNNFLNKNHPFELR